MKIIHKKLLKHLTFLVYKKILILAHKKLPIENIKIGYPQIIGIELTNDCTMQCRHCHRKIMERPVGYMELMVFQKLIDEISKYPASYLRIVGLGESSLNPKFNEMLHYASHKGIKIEITSNGEVLERFTNEEILSWDLDILAISVDGTDKESYEKIRIGGNYDRLRQRIENFHRNKTRKYPLTVIRKVILPSDTEENILQFIEDWKEISDMITFNTLSTVDNNSDFKYLPSYNCAEFYFNAHIRYDGSVILCPNKFIFDRDDVIGNIKFNRLQEIWKSEKLREIRELHKNKSYPEYCQRCFLTFNREKTFTNSRKFDFNNQPVQNKLNKYINLS